MCKFIFSITYVLIVGGVLFWRLYVLINKREAEMKEFYRKQKLNLFREGKTKFPMSSRFFSNKDCKYYPCHKGLDELNCLFCFCPLYRDENCGGNFTVLSNGIKDCSNCVFPHVEANYDKIIEKLM